MKDTKHDILTSLIDRYVRPSATLFPLSAESMLWFFERLYGDELKETEQIDAFIARDYKAYGKRESPQFKIRFIRDKHVDGLFDYYDSSNCQSQHLKSLIFNARDNNNPRIKEFCDFAIHQTELCDENLTDKDVIDYLQWMARHTPSPSSTLAAVILYQMSLYDDSIIMNLSPDQLQFIRENPELQLNTRQCK